MKRVGVYARVSTNDQDPEVQLRELRHYAERRGWRLVAEYVDHGISGAKERRPALDRLLADARRGKVDTVVCWALDRFGRSLRHLVMTIDELAAHGVGFVATSQGLDTTSTNPTSTLTLQVLGAVAQFERAMCIDRVRSGLAKARAAGKQLGRPRSRIDPARVQELRREGLSVREIAAKLGGSKSVVARLLAAPTASR